ncbi:MAG: DUF4403 family protein [Thermoanaerobaculia bacterium]|nr:DUF4403 family protein [Thermoanaerobaculia bacterium]
MRYFSIFLILAFLGLFSFCKSAKNASAPHPGEQYNMVTEAPLISTITIPVNISVHDLVNSINNRLQGVLYEDNSYTDNGKDDLMMKVTKIQPITMSLSGGALKYRVPVKIWAKQKLFIGAAEAEGELALNLKTTYSLNPDWSLSTQTEVEYHEWLAKPVLKTGIGDVGIETLANLALNRSKKTLSQTLDRAVSQQFSLKPYVQEAWTALQAPVLLDEQYRMWIKSTPLSIGITPLVSDWNTIRAKIAVDCLNDVTFGEKPAFRENSNLPNLTHITDAPEEFQVRIATDVPFPEAERLAKNMMVGQVFESGSKKVTVDDLQLWGNNDRVVVNAKLSGSFNGNIYFMGKPVMNVEKNQIEVADLDFHTETRNFLLKSAAWLFSGPIKKRMREAMTFPLDEDISELKQSVQQTLNYYQIQPGVVLTGTVDSITVEKTRITASGIRVDLFSKGKLNVDVKGL